MSKLLRRDDAMVLASRPDTFFYRMAYDAAGCRFGKLECAAADAAESEAAMAAAEADEGEERERAGGAENGATAGPSDSTVPACAEAPAEVPAAAPAAGGEQAKKKMGQAARTSALEGQVDALIGKVDVLERVVADQATTNDELRATLARVDQFLASVHERAEGEGGGVPVDK